MKLRLFTTTLSALAVLTLLARGDMVGQQLPPSSLEYLENSSDFKGKPAVIEFWATFCTPCIGLIPHLNELYAKYKGKGLVLVGVSLDEDRADIAKFRKKTPMNYSVAYDEGLKFSKALGVEAIPYSFVVDATGKVVWQGFSDQLKEETIQKVLP